MSKSRLYRILLIVIFFLCVCCQAETLFKAGFSEQDITPEAGMEVPGGYGKSHNQGEVHDPLKVRAVVFDDGKCKVALIGIDAIAIGEHITAEVRQRIHQTCGIEKHAILIGASHTHTGGPIDGTREGQFDHASDFVKKLAYEHSTMEDKVYVRKVSDAIVKAVAQANDCRVQAKACVGSGHEDQIAYNRRFHMKNGLTWTHPSGFRTKKNKDILKPAGPIDPEVGVVGVWDRSDRFLGCIVNYANHCTNGMPGISADYVYYIEKTIRSVMGEDAVVVFLNGASGDVTQVNNLSPDNTEFGVRSTRFIGTSIGAEALKVLTRAEPGNLSPVRAVTRHMSIPRRKPSPERVKACLELVRQTPEQVGSTAWTFAKEIVLLDALIQRETQVEFEIQAIQIGPAVFSANPAELFCQVGLDIKSQSTFPFTFVVELANGCIGYVPTDDAFASDGGGYETRLTSYSNLVTNAGSRICKASVALINTLTPTDVPQPPQKGPHKSPWSYGNVPPETE